MYLLIILLPLCGSLFSGFFGYLLGFRGSSLISTTCVFFSWVLSCFAFYEVSLSESVCTLRLSPWFFSEMFDATWGLYFDSLTTVMCFVITSISFFVHVYSISYMSADPHIPRFMSYLSIFTFFMLMLVTSDNFLQMFFGWEGVGLASYLLISFWFTRLQASKASIKAMLVNRVGDFGLALGIMCIFAVFKSVEFPVVFACASHAATFSYVFCTLEFHALTLICVLLFIGAIGKSAQLGLHTWLPDAMEGPTPVSALIHAATMVTAGVFLLARCSPLFEYAPIALMIVTVFGAMTCFFAATTAFVQNDLKRVIAYSTCSQLGYMVFACGISNYSVGVFHLMNHAFFKALLFLGAGSVIHALSDEQDMRKMGAVAQLLPFTYAMMCIGSFSLVGFPFLTGFYSKDAILEIAYAKYTISGNFAYAVGSLCVLFTSYYSFRCLFLTFLTPSSFYKVSAKHIHDAPFLMAFPLLVLSIGSIFVGYFMKDMMIGYGTNFWGSAVFVLPKHSALLESEYIPQAQKFLPLICTLAGALMAYAVHYVFAFHSYALKVNFLARKFYSMMNKRWYFDKVYNDFFAQPALHFGYHVSFKSLDKGIFEILGPYGIKNFFSQCVIVISALQSGMIYHYALLMLLGCTFFLSIINLWEFLEDVLDLRLAFIFLWSFMLYNFYTYQSSKNNSM